MSTPWYSDPIWQPFLYTPQSPGRHSGIDLGMPIGTALSALLPGRVISMGMMPWGGQINIQCDYPGDGQIVLSYLHASRFPVGMRAGVNVKPGQVIAYSGEPPDPDGTHKYGSGAHCHFEVSRGTQPPYMGHNGPCNPINGQFLLDAAASGALGDVAPGGVSSVVGSAMSTVGTVAIEPFGPAFSSVCYALDGIGKFQSLPSLSVPDGDSSHLPMLLAGIAHNMAAVMYRGIWVFFGLAIVALVLVNLIHGVQDQVQSVAMPSSGGGSGGAPAINPAVVKSAAEVAAL